MPTAIRTFELVVPIAGVLDVPMEDWPSHIQDGIWSALDNIAQQEELPLKIVYAGYKVDPDKGLEEPGRHYLHVIASEVVVADERTLTPGRVMREVPENVRRLLN